MVDFKLKFETSSVIVPASLQKVRKQTAPEMAGNIRHIDKCSKNFDKEHFQIELDHVASTKDNFESLTGQGALHLESVPRPYTKADTNSQVSVLSFKEPSDIQLLTEPHACIYEECLKFHSTARNDPESPFSPLKNVFLYFVLILLVTWVLVYTILSKMNYL